MNKYFILLTFFMLSCGNDVTKPEPVYGEEEFRKFLDRGPVYDYDGSYYLEEGVAREWEWESEWFGKQPFGWSFDRSGNVHWRTTENNFGGWEYGKVYGNVDFIGNYKITGYTISPDSQGVAYAVKVILTKENQWMGTTKDVNHINNVGQLLRTETQNTFSLASSHNITPVIMELTMRQSNRNTLIINNTEYITHMHLELEWRDYRWQDYTYQNYH